MTIIRFFDVFLSIILLLIFLPFFFIIAVYLKLSGHKIFFLQARVGKNKKLFRLIKFTTMRKDSELVALNDVSFNDDNRYFAVGKFLNKMKINEFPQLLNVLKGDMSFIGPRPLVEETFFDYYPRDYQELLASIRPGLSGIGSIFYANEENLRKKTTISNEEFARKYLFPYKSRLELWFVNNYNVSNYFKLIFMTVWVIIFPNKNILFSVFKTLPPPPEDLLELISS